MDNINVRKTNLHDIGSIHKIETRTFSDPWSVDSITFSIEVDSDENAVAEVDGNVVGYVFIRLCFEVAEITNVAVSLEKRKLGIASVLLNEAMNRCVQRGAMRFVLEVRESNLPAIALYRSLGFVEDGIRRDYYSNPKENALIMWKKND